MPLHAESNERFLFCEGRQPKPLQAIQLGATWVFTKGAEYYARACSPLLVSLESFDTQLHSTTKKKRKETVQPSVDPLAIPKCLILKFAERVEVCTLLPR